MADAGPATKIIMSFEQDPIQIQIGNLSKGVMEDILSSVLDCQVNYSMDMVTELSLNIFDTGFMFAKNNYFKITTDVLYTTKSIDSSEFNADGTAKIQYITLKLEIAEVSVSQSQGYNPIWNVKCRTKAIQQMKRDKNPGAVSSSSGTAFARAAALKYGLKFIGEETSKSVKINKASGTTAADSLWSVLGDLAASAKFKIFEADGTLYFASMKWLLAKWGTTTIVFNAEKTDKNGKKIKTQVTRKFIPLVPGKAGKDFELLSLPEVTKSDNDPLEARGSATITRTNGTSLRPGMTVYLDGIPMFTGYYLIQSVDFEELTPNPVSISFITPERDPKDVVQLPIGPLFPATGDQIGPAILIPFLREGETGLTSSPPFPPYTVG
jgi:hypothetical protein